MGLGAYCLTIANWKHGINETRVHIGLVTDSALLTPSSLLPFWAWAHCCIGASANRLQSFEQFISNFGNNYLLVCV